MDYKRTPEWWDEHGQKAGEELAREFGGDGAHWRRAKRSNFLIPTPPPVIKRGIGLWDLHHPGHDKKLWRNILRFTEDFDPDVWVFGGDNEDLEVISHWVGNRRLRVEGKRFNRDVLDPLDAVLRDDTRRIFHLGNHEDWVRQYIEEHPEMEGLIELEEHLHLENWEVYEYGEVSHEGKLHFMHGEYINIHNAYRTAQVYGRNIMYGHGHTFQAHTVTAPLDVHSHMAMQVPCACSINPHYRRNRPNQWVTGFSVFYVRPDGSFNAYPVIAVDGVFTAPDGTLYE